MAEAALAPERDRLLAMVGHCEPEGGYKMILVKPQATEVELCEPTSQRSDQGPSVITMVKVRI